MIVRILLDRFHRKPRAVNERLHYGLCRSIKYYFESSVSLAEPEWAIIEKKTISRTGWEPGDRVIISAVTDLKWVCDACGRHWFALQVITHARVYSVLWNYTDVHYYCVSNWSHKMAAQFKVSWALTRLPVNPKLIMQSGDDSAV